MICPHIFVGLGRVAQDVYHIGSEEDFDPLQRQAISLMQHVNFSAVRRHCSVA